MPDSVAAEAIGDAYVDGLLSGLKWERAPTYSFPRSVWYDGPENPGPGIFSINQAFTLGVILNGSASLWSDGESPLPVPPRLGYGGVSQFTNLNITRAVEYDDYYYPHYRVGAITFDNLADVEGSADIRLRGNTQIWAADVAFSTALVGTDRDMLQPKLGNYANLMYMQMVGYALGLKSASTTGAAGQIAVPADKDSLEFTVMSQRSYVGGAIDADYSVGQYDYPQSFMQLDILALQTLYGADYSYNNGDTVYRWSPVTGQLSINGKAISEMPGDNRVFMTIWDGGGNDTYSMLSFTTPVSIDLAPGASSITSQAQRAHLGDGVYARGNVYNAYLFNDNPASLIENAIGGKGNDTLRGNFADNVLNGAGGADTMIGLAGNDTYHVDYAGDVVVEAPGEGVDLVYLRASYALPDNVDNAKIMDDVGHLDVWGNGIANLLAGNGNDNDIRGGAGNDTLYGMAGNDLLDGGSGADAMIGGPGHDTYIVDSLSDIVFEKPGEGVDTLWTSVNRGLDNDFENIVLFGSATDAGGNRLNNTVSGNERGNNLYGGDGRDSLYGHDGSDRLFGESGNDYLTGGKGTDAYYGGAGYDYAILEEGGGVDYFVDFKASEDRVVFDSAIFASIGAALDAAFQNGTDVVIWDGDDGIVLQNAKLASLTTSNFLIG